MTVAAILLAAGQSRRMGTCKQLLPLAGTTVIGRCLETLQAGGVGKIVVVVSPRGTDVAAQAGRFAGVNVAVNTQEGSDMASSVRCGRDALPAGLQSVIVAPGDIPLVQPATVQALISTAVHNPSCIIIPTHAGRRGHPLLLPCIILDELAGSLTLRDVVRSDPGRVIELDVPDAGILLDMDTPEDYRRLTAISTGTG